MIYFLINHKAYGEFSPQYVGAMIQHPEWTENIKRSEAEVLVKAASSSVETLIASSIGDDASGREDLDNTVSCIFVASESSDDK
jgi:hypothetical protein